ncbi:MAG TPA: TetR/AcrR family transcriptional regulator [Candidatus Limnocylindrales bacterium]|nr:TetR/AcrR family transcriptional regulator [Candidatus Limnocylindrales bacterium]
MAPRTVNPQTHALRRDEFVDAGQRLIQTRGYEQFSIDDLLSEVGASKGAFYHYFDSKPALLEAIVARMAITGVATVADVVADPDLSAIDKLHRYFATIASFKAGQKEFLVALMRVWYSDDNAIVRQKLRRESVRLVTPHLAAIIRQGVAEGVFTLADPEHLARVILALILDTGDEAGELYLARQAGEIDLEHVRQRFATYSTALERLLGVQPGTLHLIDDATLSTWFD